MYDTDLCPVSRTLIYFYFQSRWVFSESVVSLRHVGLAIMPNFIDWPGCARGRTSHRARRAAVSRFTNGPGCEAGRRAAELRRLGPAECTRAGRDAGAAEERVSAG